LHDPTFDADYSQFESDPESMSLSWLALLFTILSIAVTALDDKKLLRDLGKKSSNSQNIATLSSRYRSAAMQCLAADQYLWRHTLYTLQALILMIYGINHTHGQSWALLGTTCNIALAIGCHIDPNHFGLELIPCEERRRCWAALTMLYTIQNTSVGSLDPRGLPTDVAMPANVNDSDLVDGRIVSNASPTQMSYVLHKFALYNLCSRLCADIFGTQRPSYDMIMDLDQSITNEQQKWNTSFLLDTQHGSSLPLHHLVQLNILNGYAHQLLLLLHRPVLMNTASMVGPIQIKLSRDRCIESARVLLSIHTTLFESPEFKQFQWYNQGLGSFHAFHAAIFLFVALASSVDSAQYYEVKQTLDTSLTVFESMVNRSRICEQAAPILRYLRLVHIVHADVSCLTLVRRLCFLGVRLLYTHALIPCKRNRSLLSLMILVTIKSPDALAICSLTKNSSNIPPEPIESLSQFPGSFEPESHMNTLFDKLQPQQWLGPAAMAWQEWEFITHGASIGTTMA
jgi:hypothetical protein